jgi:hypothetical protein
MAKSGGKDLLMEKGEKIGLGIATVLGVLFLAFGVMAMFDRPQNPDDFSKGVEGKAAELTRQMASPEAKIDPVKPELEKPVSTEIVQLVAGKNPLYDPTPVPDSRRIAPTVLPVVEAQADIAVIKVLANDFVLERNEQGEVTKVRVGVVTARTDEKVEGGGKFLKDVRGRFKGKIPPKQQPPGFGGGMPGPGLDGAGGARGGSGGPGSGGGFPGPGGVPGFPGGGGGAMGYGGSSSSPSGFGGGMPGSGFGGGPPGFGSGAGMPGSGGMRGGSGGLPGAGFPGGDMFGGSQSAGQRFAVEYIEGENDEEIERKLNGRRLAITIKPQRMTVIQASFPYRAQLEKFRIALRHQKLEELYQHAEDMPVFYGVDVQRKAYRPRNGGRDLDQLEDWQSIDLAGNSQDLRAVTLVYKEETPPDIQRVMLHEDHMLVMPLPHEMPGAGKYPEMRLPELKKAMEKQRKLDPKSQVPPPTKSKYSGGDNPFKKGSGPQAGMYNLGGEGAFQGLAGMFQGPGKGKTGTDAALTGAPSAYQPPDYVYVRVYDTDIKDGLVYEYRIRVKVKNPNFQRKGEVSKASDADNEELPPQEDHWFVVPNKVSVPQGGYSYVTEWTRPKERESRPLSPPDERLGQAVLQFQRWYEYLDLPGGLKEPIGDWVQSELLATRGMFVTGKAFAPLPFWSSVENRFVLREIPGEKVAKGKDPRRGAMIEPVRPKALLAVEVAGGKVKADVKPNPGERTNRGGLVVEETATEVLFMLPDGSLEVKSSARDKANADRKEREEHFKKWVEETEAQNPSGPPPKKKDDF